MIFQVRGTIQSTSGSARERITEIPEFLIEVGVARSALSNPFEGEVVVRGGATEEVLSGGRGATNGLTGFVEFLNEFPSVSSGRHTVGNQGRDGFGDDAVANVAGRHAVGCGDGL